MFSDSGVLQLAHVIGDHEPLKLGDIESADGGANTLMFGEVAGGYRPWGHPRNFRDPALGLGRAADQFGSPEDVDQPVNFAFADGSARGLNPDIDPGVLKALATPDGGEKIDPGAF